MPNKTCNKCNNEMSVEFFGKRKDSADGYRATCKACVAAAKNGGTKPPVAEKKPARPRGSAAEPTPADNPIVEEENVVQDEPATTSTKKETPVSKVPTLNQLSKSTGKTFIIDPADIVIKPENNVRVGGIDDEHAKGFANSLKQGLYVPPILVRKTKEGWELVAGYHRCEGFFIAKDELGDELVGLEAQEYKGGSDAAIVAGMLENDGKPLTGLDRAHNYAKLVGLKWSINKIAEQCNRSRSDVEKHLILAEATEPVKLLVADGTISVAVAVEFVRKYGDDAHTELTKKLAKAAGLGGKKGNGGTTPVKADPKFPNKKCQEFINLARYIQIDDDCTDDEKVTIFAELSPEQWSHYGDLIEQFKAFLEENE